MHVLAGHRYTYRPRNVQCLVTQTFPERHRVIVMLDTGQEMQEVPFSDLENPTAVVTQQPIEAVVVEQLDEQKEDSAYPNRASSKRNWKD